MAFKAIEEAYRKRVDEFRSHVSPQFLTWLNDCISKYGEVPGAAYRAYVEQCGMNSFEREILYPNLSDQALADVAAYCLSQCRKPDRRPSSCYDDSILQVFAPLLIDRLRSKLEPPAPSAYKDVYQPPPGGIYPKVEY